VTGAAILLLLASLQSCGGQKADRPLTILVSVEANTLDPHFATSTIEWSILMNVFDSLVSRKDDMTLGPGLAERWGVDESKRLWTFHLRKGVKFHNDEPFDARSVKYTFERMQDQSLRPRTTIPRRIFLKEVEVVDDHTVRIHTRRRVATLPIWLVNAFILPPKYYSATPAKEVLAKPVGTGPYRLVKWVKDDHIRMEANAAWWGGKPKIETAVWRPVPETSARIAELETGGADLITNVSPDQMHSPAGREKKIQLKGIHGGRRVYVGVRTDQGVLGDRRVRQAMNHAVNFDLIASTVLVGHGSRMASVVNPPNNDPSLKPYPYDPEKAKALLAEAGLKDTDGDGILEANGQPLRLKLDVPIGRYLKGEEIAAAVASNLRAVGIHVEVNLLEWSVFLSRRSKKILSPLYLHGFSSAFDAELDLGALRPSLFANLTAWKHPEFIAEYQKLRQSFDPEELRRISFRLQRLVIEEAPWIFLWHQYDFFGLSARIGWLPRPDERIYLPSIAMRDAQN